MTTINAEKQATSSASPQKQRIEDILGVLQLHPTTSAITQEIAASLIVDSLIPNHEGSAGAELYRLKAVHWLSLLLSSEPKVSGEQLSARVTALASISAPLKTELGGLAARLQTIYSQTS